jgi:hypothetical protein
LYAHISALSCRAALRRSPVFGRSRQCICCMMIFRLIICGFCFMCTWEFNTVIIVFELYNTLLCSPLRERCQDWHSWRGVLAYASVQVCIETQSEYIMHRVAWLPSADATDRRVIITFKSSRVGFRLMVVAACIEASISCPDIWNARGVSVNSIG